MRLFLYLNLIAIIFVAGALAKLYEGAPLPWGSAPPMRLAIAPDTTTSQQAIETGKSDVVSPAPARQADAPLTIEQVVALRLPLENPVSSARQIVALPPEADGRATELIFLTEGDYRPFNYMDSKGELAGFDIELGHALCAKLNRACRFERRSWGDLVPALKRGEGSAIISSILIPMPGREAIGVDKALVFTRGYYSTPARFLTRKGAGIAAILPETIEGARIAVQAGSVHHAYARREFSAAELVTYPTVDEAISALEEGEVRLLFADRNRLLEWMTKPAGKCCHLIGPEYADADYFGSGAGIALRSEDVELQNALNEALLALVTEGKYAEISRRHFSTSIY